MTTWTELVREGIEYATLPLNFFIPFGKSAIFSYHSVISTTVLYQVQAFRSDVQCAGGKVKMSEFIYYYQIGS